MILCFDDDGIVFIYLIMIIVIGMKDVNFRECDDCVIVNDFDCVLLLSLMMLYEDLVGLRLKLCLVLLISVFLFN